MQNPLPRLPPPSGHSWSHWTWLLVEEGAALCRNGSCALPGVWLVSGLCLVCLYLKFGVARFSNIHETLCTVLLPVPARCSVALSPIHCSARGRLSVWPVARSGCVFSLFMLIAMKETPTESSCLFMSQ